MDLVGIPRFPRIAIGISFIISSRNFIRNFIRDSIRDFIENFIRDFSFRISIPKEFLLEFYFDLRCFGLSLKFFMKYSWNFYRSTWFPPVVPNGCIHTYFYYLLISSPAFKSKSMTLLQICTIREFVQFLWNFMRPVFSWYHKNLIKNAYDFLGIFMEFCRNIPLNFIDISDENL